MSYPYYSKEPVIDSPDVEVELPDSEHQNQINPAHYLADEGLVNAVNVALILGRPLLLTGEAGTGKTQLAYNLAHKLGLPKPLKFETKSNSSAKDLFYIYDYLGHFYAAQTKQSAEKSQNYITYNALGLAILRANPVAEVEDIINSSFNQLLEKPRRSVVLIDEIDKAPRDFPNDILNEVEEMSFRIAELQNREVKASSKMRPIVILTSNTEKHLPDAFLRRCVFYHIPFPDKDRLAEIVIRQLNQEIRFLDLALDFFETLRKSGLRKKPATAELLNWLTTLCKIFPKAKNKAELSEEMLNIALGCLAKQEEDVRKTEVVIKNWLKVGMK